MKKLIVLVIVVWAGTAVAQPNPGAPDVPPEPTAGATKSAAELRAICAEAMNKDPAFAKAIVLTADKQADQRAIDMHLKAAEQVAENERHVIYAYAAMWIFAALFVVFLWRRQQVLKSELAQLRKDLDAATKEGK